MIMGIKKYIMLTAAAIIMAVVCDASSAEKSKYNFKFEKGQKYYVRVIDEQETRQIVGSREEIFQRSFGYGYDFDVTDVDEDGSAWIEQTCRWVCVKLKMPQGEAQYDSSKKDAKVKASLMAFAGFLDEGFFLNLTPQGHAKEARGFNMMYSFIKGKLPSVPQRKKAMEDFKSRVNETAIKELVDSIMFVCPDEAVSVGDSWKRKVVLSNVLPVIFESTFRLKTCDSNVAVIEVATEIKPDMSVEPIGVGDSIVGYELAGSRTGQVELERSKGYIIRSNIKEEMSGQIKVRPMSSATKGWRKFPIEIKNTITFEMTERKKEYTD